MAFSCGENYTDGKNVLKTIHVRNLYNTSSVVKKYESRFAIYMFTNERKKNASRNFEI